MPSSTTAVLLRPVSPADAPFLRKLYATTRQQEMALTGWSDRQVAEFVDMQFAAQSHHYETHFPSATHQIVVMDRAPVGRLYVDRRPAEIRLLDITLLPQFRNLGIGSNLIKGLLDEGRQAGQPVRLYVWEQNGAARRLYARLGFREVEHQSGYILMAWWPDDSA